MNLRKHLLLTTLTLFMLVSATSTFAQQKEEESTATLKETISWLGEKLIDENFSNQTRISSSDEFNYFERNDSSKVKVNNCTLILETERIRFKEDNSSEKILLTIPFSDFDPLSFKKEGNYKITLSTTNSKKSVQLRREWYINGLLDTEGETTTNNGKIRRTRTLSSSIIELWFPEENINRAERAIKHLLKLCGGKVDPF